MRILTTSYESFAKEYVKLSINFIEKNDIECIKMEKSKDLYLFFLNNKNVFKDKNLTINSSGKLCCEQIEINQNPIFVMVYLEYKKCFPFWKITPPMEIPQKLKNLILFEIENLRNIEMNKNTKKFDDRSFELLKNCFS